MKHFLLFYDGAPDYLERRPQFRDPTSPMPGRPSSAARSSSREPWQIRSTERC